ncbi:3641_t:CDS:1 [Cetraspora pellucida]|uniref:3641_t:CDS:1 n=1 Tax=Cetraspora pellucida TaxID=1433469 RepID=A0A9N9GGX2_9GLOM|nr:3641_t:CDS:1 [Cetraspora pellucida]
MNIIPKLNLSILSELQCMLHYTNPYCRIFRQVRDIVSSNQSVNLKMVITDNKTKDPRHYNTLSATEVAIIMIEDGQEADVHHCDIVHYLHNSKMQRISEIHHTYELLHYVLIFPRGKNSWHPNISRTHISFSLSINDFANIDALIINDEEKISTRKYVTAMNYFAYCLHLGHPNEPIVLHLFGRLFQQ